MNVAETIGGLQPYRRYHFRVVATNEAGRSVSTNRTFTTQPPADGRLALARVAARRLRREGLEVFGRVSGSGVNGIQVALERQDFPFAGPFSSTGAPAPIKADRSGAFRFDIPALFSATRLRVLTRTAVVATSPPVTAQVGLRVGIATRRATRRAVRIRGSVLPAAPSGRAVLQRMTRGGSWVFVRGGSLRALGERRSRFGFKVRKRRAAQVYRVRVIARDGGAHVPGTSRSVGVGPAQASLRPGSGRPKWKPCASGQPMSRSISAWDSCSTPSATTSIPSARAHEHHRADDRRVGAAEVAAACSRRTSGRS